MTEQKSGESEQSARQGYETRDIRVRPLVVFVAGLTVLLVFSFLVVLWLFRLFSVQHANQDTPLPTQAIAQQGTAASSSDEQLRWPEPRVQSRPADDLKAVRAEEDRLLTTYGWIDRPNGVVRVPIDVAMQLVEKEGLPAQADRKSR